MTKKTHKCKDCPCENCNGTGKVNDALNNKLNCPKCNV